MITIWKLNIEMNSWELIEQLHHESELAQRLHDLRLDGSEYRAELKIDSFSSILEV
jgi:hypothetical protein